MSFLSPVRSSFFFGPLLTLLLVALSGDIAGAEQAQDDKAMAADSSSDTIVDVVVVTGTGRKQRLLDQAGNTGRVGSGDIELVRQDHISEAINRVSGVTALSIAFRSWP